MSALEEGVAGIVFGEGDAAIGEVTVLAVDVEVGDDVAGRESTRPYVDVDAGSHVGCKPLSAGSAYVFKFVVRPMCVLTYVDAIIGNVEHQAGLGLQAKNRDVSFQKSVKIIGSVAQREWKDVTRRARM